MDLSWWQKQFRFRSNVTYYAIVKTSRPMVEH